MAVVFVPKESDPERRVAAVPETVRRLVKDGHVVRVESGAGARAFVPDEDFASNGAAIERDRARGWAEADVVLHVGVPAPVDAERLKPSASTVGFLWPLESLDVIRALSRRRASAYALDELPRTSRAQKYDALTSQASLAGYRAVVVAASLLPKIFPLQMTPAGTIRPARVVVVGAGVAGLQAVATARRLGAVVEVSDVRPEAKEQVQSLGATFIEVEGGASGAGGYATEASAEFRARQAAALADRVAAADVVVTTALVPYRPAPRILTDEVLARMRPGSVVVDLAAERGGNCAWTVPGSTVVRNGVTVVGERGVAASVAVAASDQYARNVQAVVSDATKKGAFAWDLADDVVAASLVVHDGEVRHARTREALGLPPLPAPAGAAGSVPASAPAAS